MAIENLIVGYLAPELTALESTYVYEEIKVLQKKGITVIPVSVRRPAKTLVHDLTLIQQTTCLYDAGILRVLKSAISHCFHQPKRYLATLSLLFSDIARIGWLNTQAAKLVFQFLMASQLVNILKQYHCQHLHVHFAHVPTQIAMYASALSGVPFTVTAHANDIFERGLLLKQKAERAKKFLTISEYNLRYLVNLGLPPEKLAVVRCGVSFDMATPRLSTEKQVYQLGTLGRLVEKKGIDVLLHALSLLNNEAVCYKLDIAGDGPLRDELEALTVKLGLQDSVSFIGVIDHKQVAEWMRSLDAFVLACKQDASGDQDGIPVVLMEAMSQAVSVISTELSGIPELVIPGQTGLLAQPGDAENLALQIRLLFANPEQQQQWIKNAQQHLDSEFSQTVNITRLLSHINV